MKQQNPEKLKTPKNSKKALNPGGIQGFFNGGEGGI